MEHEIIIRLPKKIRKYVIAGQIIGTAVLVAVTVYRLIPKDEKITGVNTEAIVSKYSA